MGYERPLQCLPLSFMFVVFKRDPLVVRSLGVHLAAYA